MSDDTIKQAEDLLERSHRPEAVHHMMGALAIDMLPGLVAECKLREAEWLECHNCGKPLKNVHGRKLSGDDILLGEIRLDPGEPASSAGPEIDAEYYFCCSDCQPRAWLMTPERVKALQDAIEQITGESIGVRRETRAAIQAMLAEAGQ